ncbi:hypothetical protein MO387_08450 [Shewanella sp. N2AIL]|uniref:hypothetical protein n=1 Tax=Shewanella sp. N2AIL TaxID=2926851 RepID=UPI001F5900E7|nr:hypothetical protein [Shewanella sp. N2AIL]MCI2963116.1 hypothetical protein [Shewanella sp. N2AIL]
MYHCISTKHLLGIVLAAVSLTACNSNDDDEPSSEKPSFTVTATASGGSISPLSIDVTEGGTTNFTLTADSNYHINTVTGCNGSLSGSTYTTGVITAACSVNATFAIDQHTVSVTVGSGGSVSPMSATVDHGSTTSFTLTPQSGFGISSASGCNGALVDSTYTTGDVTADCSVTVSFIALNSISGTAAAGAPIIGQVWIKDVNGLLRNSAIGLNGSYSIDVTDMVPPLLVNARGTVGGRVVNYSSVAQTADLGGTINITPFTDLILANVLGQITTNYFDAPNFGDLSSEAVEAARATLTARLLPVLAALGLDASINLLTESFNADHTGLDAALDVLRVDIDPVSNVATILNVLTQQSISDDLTSTTDNSVLPEPGNITAALSDFDAIIARFNAFAAMFASEIPAVNDPVYLAHFHANFKESGSTDPNDILLNDPGMGWTIGQYQIIEKVSDTDWLIGGAVYDAQGPSGETFEMHAFKDGANWKLAGNQAEGDLSMIPQVFRSKTDGSYVYDSHIEFNFDSPNGNIAYIGISGPGLSYTYTNSFDGFMGAIFDVASYEILNDERIGTGQWLPDCSDNSSDACFARNMLQVGRNYTMQAYDSNLNTIGSGYSIALKAIPTTAAIAESKAAELYPTITSVSKGGSAVSTLAQAALGGEFSVSWTLPENYLGSCITILGFQIDGSLGYQDSRNQDLACHDTSATVSHTAYDGVASWAAVWTWLLQDDGVEYGESYQWLP